jgi:hypothetical protein
LLVYHFMFGRDFKAGCRACPAIAEGFSNSVLHLENDDVAMRAVSRASIEGTTPTSSGFAAETNTTARRKMTDQRTISDRVEIEALRGEFSDACLMGDWVRFAGLFTLDGAWRMPHIGIEFEGRDQIRTGIGRMQDLWDYFIQTTHPGFIQLEGDTATGRAYISEFGHLRDGRSHLNYSLYHDQ